MLQYWIWFATRKDLPLWQKKALLQQYENPEDIFYADPQMLGTLENMTPAMVSSLQERDLSEAEDILKKCRKKNIEILPFWDEKYPERLRNIEDPPVVLYFRGILPQWDTHPFLAVVGTRKATAYGQQMAGRLGEEIARCGGTVVSGGASGIDSRALEGALNTGCPAVCVLGCGADVIYPRTNRRLFSQIAENGCILSEYSPGEKPLGWHFLQRNRILSGISHGVVVVEAPERSGALNTARHGLEQGRDLYAVPANVGVAAYAGSNRLLQQGAMAVLNGWDAVKSYALCYPDTVRQQHESAGEFMESSPSKVAQKPLIPEKVQKISIDNLEKSSYSVLNDGKTVLTDEEQAILGLLSRHPVHSDQVAEQSDLPEARVQSLLTKLTLRGYIQHHPGGRVSLK